jgi:uncharacterized membrane protein YccC
MARGKKTATAGEAAVGAGINLGAHPRARRHIRMAKGWSGLIAFAIVLYLSRGAGLPFADGLLRGLLGGIAGYVVGWMVAVTVWRQIAMAELEDLRARLLAKADAEAEARAAARAQEAAEKGEGLSIATMASQP